MSPRRASIRVRLTAWYSAIFFLLGAVLANNAAWPQVCELVEDRKSTRLNSSH